MQASPTAFVSHSSKDAALAMQLCTHLESKGVNCWIAPRDVTPGQPYADEIVRGIEGCVAFVLLATPESIPSRNVLNELEQAHRLARNIYTVMVNGPRLTGEFSYYIARLHWLEGKTSDMDQVAARIADVLYGTRRWEAVATPPSLGRRIRSVMPSFAGALVAVLLGLVLAGGLGWYIAHRVQHAIATDYRSLGWTTLETTDDGMREPLAVGHLWLGDAALPFASVQLRVRLTGSGPQQDNLLDLSSQLPQQGSGQAEFELRLPKGVGAVTTYLTLPQSSKLFCVEQAYAFGRDNKLIPTGPVRTSVINETRTCL